MSKAQVGIVWNPSKTNREELEAVVRSAADVRVSWFETSPEDPGRVATQEALDAGAEVVVAAGGDGTVRAVAEQLAVTQAQADLGIIPLGTGNLLARNLDIPLNDLTAAFARALEGSAVPLDLGWAELTLPGGTERRAFAVMAGFGIDAHMITETNEDLKDRAGWLAYLESLGRAASATEVVNIRLAINDGKEESRQGHTLLIGNCGQLQAGVILLPDADPSDGELDLLVLDADNFGGWVDTLRNVVWENRIKRFLVNADTAESSESVTHQRITRLTIELDEPRVFEIDGDALGETTRIEVSVQPAAIRVR